MVEQAFPFDTGPGANVLESEWQKMARRWLATGVIPAFREELQVTANGAARQVTVQTGAGWVEGFWYDTDADVVLPVDAADATRPRLDACVLRLDRLANTMTLDVVPGVPAAVPVLPALSQTDGLWELLLAEVRVPAAAGVITAADVTDRRQFTRNLTLADMAAEVARTNAAYVPTGAVKANVFTFESTTATTPSDLATVGPSQSIVVPPSGLVKIDLQAWMRNATIGEQTYLGYALSGAVVQAPRLDQSAVWDMDSSEYLTLSTSVLTDPLPPGQTLTVTVKQWVTAGVGWYGNRRLLLTPQ